MTSSALPPYLLQELPDITEVINQPLKNAQRIKYTCFDVSKTLIVFGATSGGIYIFNRHPCEFVQLIPNKDGAITRLAISSDENYVAFANGRGVVHVTPCEQNASQSSISSKEHQGNEVTTMVWSSNNLFIGDDIGKVSVLQLPSFITKTMFQNSAQAIMTLDSRICQLDVKYYMLLVSTLTRCYICDTQREQYRQIGQKLRDGEFGACFVTKSKPLENGTLENTKQDFSEIKKYSIVNNEEGFIVNEKLANILIYCARPSSRLWEATINGTVIRTHQFKQVLAKTPLKIISAISYDNENVSIDLLSTSAEGKSCNFSKLYNVNNGAIFSYTKNALYFLNTNNVDDTVWSATHKDVVACSIYKNDLFLWLANGSIVSLMFMKIDKYLLKCFFDEKFVLCGKLCALYKSYLLSNHLPNKLRILVGLKEKLKSYEDLLNEICDVLTKLETLEYCEASQTKSGIYIVDNSYRPLFSDEEVSESDTKYSNETIQAFKEISSTVTDKLNISKKILKEKWESVEEKVKHLHITSERPQQNFTIQKTITPETAFVGLTPPFKQEIVHKESSHKPVDTLNDKNRILKSLYQYHRLSLVNTDIDASNLTSTIENYSCDIKEIYKLILELEQYCVNIDSTEEAKTISNNIFLSYINSSANKDQILDVIISEETLYKYFIDSCIYVNLKTQKLSNLGCECGFPLPYIRTYQSPDFSHLIDTFIEKQWLIEPQSACYEICKQMPFLWRKILYLRRNEDLVKILRILLQMLDENLLHTFLPQFTLDTWEAAIKLYATLHANICLNCGRKFENIIVKNTLSWDSLGALMIKSIGGRTAIKMMEKHAELINMGEVTMKFYHTSLLVCLYEEIDSGISLQLTDTLYSAYDNEEARFEICRLLRSTIKGTIKNTSLPIIVAAQSIYWGMYMHSHEDDSNNTTDTNIFGPSRNELTQKFNVTLQEILKNLTAKALDCSLCGLPLINEVLVRDAGLWVFKCGHIFHGACLDLNKVKLCPSCTVK